MKKKRIVGLTHKVEPKRKPLNPTVETPSEDIIHDAQDAMKHDAVLSRHQVVGLQRVIGNQAVQRLLIQRDAKLTVQQTPPAAVVQRVEEGVDYVHSEHSKERMEERNISVKQLEMTLENPDYINDATGGASEYLSKMPSGLILRAVVSNDTPMTIITVMKVRKHKSYPKKK